jgi:YD repeat-containing protein
LYSYDGFGNLYSQQPVPGKQGPSISVSVDATKNRLTASGFSYDNNGNAISTPQTPQLDYDVDNRTVYMLNASGSARRYAYDPSNLRVWSRDPNVDDLGTLTMWGPGGQKLAE